MLINRLFKQILSALFTYVIITTAVMADEVTEVVNDVAAKLVQQLPMDKKIALKSLSPDETGLPEDFLRKLTSDLEAALLTASDFEINLANRLSLEDVWQEAVEFNNADFDELFKSANADVMLMMSPRAISTGVEIAITAYSLTGDDVGKTLASSGSVLLPIDLQANLGVDVNDLNKQMAQVLAEIKEMGQTGGLISDANTFAEYYHNASIFQRRGEVDLAMQNYEKALEGGYLFVDPLLNLLDLANARYGEAGTKKYFERKIHDKLPKQLRELGQLKLGIVPFRDLYSEDKLLKDNIFAPSLSIWLNTEIPKYFVESIKYYERNYLQDYAFMESARLVQNSYNSGDFQSYFIDKQLATELVNLSSLENILADLNRFEFTAEYISIGPSVAQSYKNISECRISNDPLLDWDGKTVLRDEEAKPIMIESITPIWDNGIRDNALLELLIEPNGINPRCGEKYQESSTRGFRVPPSRLSTTNSAKCPVTPELDRVVFADFCAREQYLILSKLLITDRVDTSQPILLEILELVDMEDGYSFSSYTTDISIDGTYIEQDGAPLRTDKLVKNGWFYAPGFLQSTLQNTANKLTAPIFNVPIPFVQSITYTDLYGAEKTVKNHILASGSCCFKSPDNGIFLENLGSIPIVTGQGVSTDSIHWHNNYDIPLRYIESWKYEPGIEYSNLTSGSRGIAESKAVNENLAFSDMSAAIKNIFLSESADNRRLLQEHLKVLGFYKSGIDGRWGNGTEAAFTQLFVYLDNYYPDRRYVSDFGFDDGQITRDDFVDFWNGMYSCDAGKLLSITSACGN